MPKVSIIVPVYNSEKYLDRCIKSLIDQSLKDIEIIFVNDGSTDKSYEILKEYKKTNDNIKLINQNRLGVIEARINGLRHANGEYISWMDSDDFAQKDMYEKMYNRAKEKDLEVLICNYNFYPNKMTNKQKWFKPYKGKIDNNFIQQNTVLWNKIVKKELIDKLNVSNLLNIMGESAYALILINAKKVDTINECLYNYRVGHNSLSSNFKKIDWFEEVVKHQINKLNYVIEHKYDKKWIELFTYTYLYYSSILMIIGAYNGKKDIYRKYKKIIRTGGLFGKKYKKYIKNDLSIPKVLFIKYIAVNSYWLSKTISRVVL